MRKILIDCDPGHDDIFAILVALAHLDELDIVGFTTVAGNQTVEKVTDNLLRVLDCLNLQYDVAQGAGKPLYYEAEPQPMAHGEGGLDGPVLEDAKSKPHPLVAHEYLYEKLSQSEEKITLVGLGPLTNIALLLKEHPDIKEKIDSIHIMGGSLHSGNIIPKAEFNIYHDPHAAKIVFNSGIPVVMSGLEVCQSGYIWHNEAEILNHKGRVSQLAYDLYQFYSLYSKRHGSETTTIFDMTPIIHLLRPEMFTSAYYTMDVETEGSLCRGMTVADIRPFRENKETNVQVLLEVQRGQFIRYFLDSINKLDKEYTYKHH